MTPDRTLLLVGSNDEMVRKAKDLGLHVLLFQHPTKVTEEQRRVADQVHVLDYTDWSAVEPLVTALHREPGFTAAVSMSESGQEVTGRINDLLDLGGTGYEVAHLVRDKWAMRQHMATRDPAAVGAERFTDRAALEAFGARYGYPFIVKPCNTTASFGVFRVAGPHDLDRVWDGVRELQGTFTDRGSMPFPIQDFVVEEYVDGPEFSVESFSFGGRHVIITVTEKFVDPVTFTEIGHVMPARLSEPVWEQVRETVIRFLDLIGVQDGPGHTEVRIGARGPAVIETHNRIGGDAIPDLLVGAYDVDLPGYTFGWPFRLFPELPDRPQVRGGASTRFMVGVPGRVESVEGVKEARAHPDVLSVTLSVAPGAATRSPQDNWDRLAMVAGVGDDASDAIRRTARIAEEHIRIRMAGDDGTARLARVADVGEPDDAPGTPA